MENKLTLKELFESRKDELAAKLVGLTLPKDVNLVQTTVTNYLNGMFDSEGDFRQNLTQSEDYILQAAMSLLNAQQKISSALASEVDTNVAPKKMQTSSTRKKAFAKDGNKINSTYTMIGAAGGAIAGKLILGGWGAVFGAIAGVALSIYLSNKKQGNIEAMPVSELTQEKDINKPIDIDSFIIIINNVCESVDNLIRTFRAQVNRVVQKYEDKERPVLEKEYGLLLDCIQSLIGASFQSQDDKKLKKIETKIEDLSESLENYGLEVVLYDEQTKNFFDEIVSENVNKTTMVLPAILKQGRVVRKGKVFVNNK